MEWIRFTAHVDLGTKEHYAKVCMTNKEGELESELKKKTTAVPVPHKSKFNNEGVNLLVLILLIIVESMTF